MHKLTQLTQSVVVFFCTVRHEIQTEYSHGVAPAVAAAPASRLVRSDTAETRDFNCVTFDCPVEPEGSPDQWQCCFGGQFCAKCAVGQDCCGGRM